MQTFSQQELEQVVNQHREWLNTLLQSKAIFGYGVGLDRGGGISIQIHGNQTSRDVEDAIRQQFVGHPVAIEEHGEPRLQSG